MPSQQCRHCGQNLSHVNDAFCTFCQQPVNDEGKVSSANGEGEASTKAIQEIEKATDKQQISLGCRTVSRGLVLFSVVFVITGALMISTANVHDGSAEQPPDPTPQSGIESLCWAFVYLVF